MTLRCRGYVVEATYRRDVKMRRVAESFYRQLVKYLKRHKDNIKDVLTERPDGSYYVRANKFWKHPKANSLVIVFEPSGRGYRGAMGTSGSFDVMVISDLIAPKDPRHLHTRMDRETVVHELVHYLTPGRPGGSGTAKMAEKGETAAFFNSPAEWQAYWQQGAVAFERTLRWDTIRDPRVRERFVGDGSLRDLSKRLHLFWDDRFLEHMNKKTRRKFDKRLAQLWTAMKKKGLL